MPVISRMERLKATLLIVQPQILVQGVRIACQGPYCLLEMLILDLMVVGLVDQRDLAEGLEKLLLNF